MAISERLSQAVEKAWRIEQLMAANHAYLEMLAFVSHEIKNPVASHGHRRAAAHRRATSARSSLVRSTRSSV